ncbi:hypothetical protein ACTFIW_002457 [Dictyostelium discoideum]
MITESSKVTTNVDIDQSLGFQRLRNSLLVIPVHSNDSSSLFCLETKDYVFRSHIFTSSQSTIDLAVFQRISNLFNIVFTIIDIHNFISSKNVDNNHLDIGSIGSAIFSLHQRVSTIEEKFDRLVQDYKHRCI